jgi:hypothetical protein
MTEPHDYQETRQREPAADALPPPPLAEPSTGGAKLFVIFFLTLVPLIGMALLAMVIYSLLMR